MRALPGMIIVHKWQLTPMARICSDRTPTATVRAHIGYARMTGMESMTGGGVEIGRTPTHAVETGDRGRDNGAEW